MASADHKEMANKHARVEESWGVDIWLHYFFH